MWEDSAILGVKILSLNFKRIFWPWEVINLTLHIKHVSAVNGIIFGNQLTERQTTKVSMAVSCKFPLDYTVTADYPFLPQITMQLLRFNVSGLGEFSAVMQLYEDDQFQRAFEGTPEIEEGEMLNVGVSLLDTEVQFFWSEAHF